MGVRVVTSDEIDLRRLVIDHSRLCVFSEVENNRSRPSALSDIESPADSPSHILRPTNLEIPLGDRRSDAHDIDLLESVGTEHSRSDLSADDDHGCAVNHGIRYTSDGVGGTWSTGDDATSHFSGYSGESLCGVCGSLFMTYEYMIESVPVVIKSVENGHDSTSGITENGFHPFVHQ